MFTLHFCYFCWCWWIWMWIESITFGSVLQAFWGLVLLSTRFGSFLNDYYFILCSVLLIFSLSFLLICIWLLVFLLLIIMLLSQCGGLFSSSSSFCCCFLLFLSRSIIWFSCGYAFENSTFQYALLLLWHFSTSYVPILLSSIFPCVYFSLAFCASGLPLPYFGSSLWFFCEIASFCILSIIPSSWDIVPAIHYSFGLMCVVACKSTHSHINSWFLV